MFITPISYSQNSLKIYQTPKVKAKNVINNSVSSVSFYGYKPNPELIKNQYRIMLTQDIWAEKLAVKMPETPLEREVLLEVLAMRKKLDRFTRLTNERARIRLGVNRLADLREKDPQNPEIASLTEELRKKGNLVAAMATLDKNIELEANKNAQAIEYFKEIERLEEEYLANHSIKSNAISKFCAQIRRNNINSENQYSTQELINIVANGEKPVEPQAVATTKPVAQNLTKKQLLISIKKDYEQYLRENINVYRSERHLVEAEQGRDNVRNKYKSSISKFPGIEKQLNMVFDEIHRLYRFKTDSLYKTEIYAVGGMWQEMDKVLAAMKSKRKEINSLKEKLAQNEKDDIARITLYMAEEELSKMQTLWTKTLNLSMIAERKNYETFAELGKADIYEYLTAENKEIIRYKDLAETCYQNKGVLPNEVWEEILA